MWVHCAHNKFEHWNFQVLRQLRSINIVPFWRLALLLPNRMRSVYYMFSYSLFLGCCLCCRTPAKKPTLNWSKFNSKAHTHTREQIKYQLLIPQGAWKEPKGQQNIMCTNDYPNGNVYTYYYDCCCTGGSSWSKCSKCYEFRKKSDYHLFSPSFHPMNAWKHFWNPFFQHNQLKFARLVIFKSLSKRNTKWLTIEFLSINRCGM